MKGKVFRHLLAVLIYTVITFLYNNSLNELKECDSKSSCIRICFNDSNTYSDDSIRKEFASQYFRSPESTKIKVYRGKPSCDMLNIDGQYGLTSVSYLCM